VSGNYTRIVLLIPLHLISSHPKSHHAPFHSHWLRLWYVCVMKCNM